MGTQFIKYNLKSVQFSSLQFSHSVVSNSLRLNCSMNCTLLQHARPPCASLTPGVYPNSCPLSRWCHLTTSSSVFHFSSCLKFWPAPGFFSKESDSSSHQVAKVLELQHQSFQWIVRTDNFRIEWFDLLAVQGTLKSLLQHCRSKASFLWCSVFFIVQLSRPYMTTGKTIALIRWTFVDKVISLLLNMLSRLVIAFLPRSKHLLISWLQSTSAVILEPPKIKSVTVSTVSPSICHEVMGLDAMILVFWMLSAKTIFILLFHFHQEVLVPPLFLP